MLFGDRLRHWRGEQFLTQKELAAQLGVMWQTVSRWESGKGFPYPSTRRRMIDVLKVTPDELRTALGEIESEKKSATVSQ